ncbi:hypothetical protein [Flavimaricola marinus]|uniref:Phage tail protein (Tail_P2_I) n=1 Tax=Flavimaricola marinus TaxID=1819565 RepID=A0A238L973_9RHOB|nr:hypothetical protein [Flavimaricola marinus]SMY06257.1 hypothetical protein LOM8899_00380 [Flavimaricola marinus]
MAVDLQDLFERLPAYHRRKDHTEGGKVRGSLDAPHSLTDAADYGPLKSLLSVMLREGQIVAEDIAQLYDDHFIETCAPWLIPYIGALVGARPLEDFGDVQSARAWVAVTIALRQRKGTLAALEVAVRAATGWPVVAVEYWSRVCTTESLRRVRIVDGNELEITPAQAWTRAQGSPPARLRHIAGSADLGRTNALDRVGTAFDSTPRRAEMGRIEHGAGRWNLPNIGLHLHRIEAVTLGSPYPGEDGVGGSPGHLVEATHAGSGMYRFSPFRADQPLFQRPAVADHGLDKRPTEADLPIPISRRMLDAAPGRYCPWSFAIHVTTAGGTTTLDADQIKAANLASVEDVGGNEAWLWGPRAGVALVDPELGRFTLPTDIGGVTAVHVTWHYGRAHSIGGHERTEVPEHDGTGAIPFPASTRVLLSELADVVDQGVDKLLVLTGESPRLVALEGASPTLDLEGNTLILRAPAGASAMLSGLRIINGRLVLEGIDDPGDDILGHGVTWRIEDCTITEQASLDDDQPNGSPWFTLLVRAGIDLTIERSIIAGQTQLRADVVLTAIDSILRARRLSDPAISRGNDEIGQTLSLVRSTVIGRVDSFAVGGSGPGDIGGMAVTGVEPAALGISDSLIVTDPNQNGLGLNIMATQEGCVRYSRIPGQSRAPRRYRSLPETGQDEWDVYPQFTSLDLADPGFLQLAEGTPAAILRGGENGSEMGVGNRQMAATRLRNLKRTTEEFLRFGYSTGPIFET